jgi:Domain of Unknown Function (DUF1543)
MKLFQILIGCTPKGRHIEQHDIYFGIAETIADMIPQLKTFWPEAADNMHLDGYKTITAIDGYAVTVVPKDDLRKNDAQLFFINLGGYKPEEFEEYHYKMVLATKTKSEAIRKSKENAFYQHTGFKGAESHIDDKYGIDVDDVFAIADVLPEDLKSEYKILVQKADGLKEDKLHLGYFQLKKLLK